MMWFKLAFVLFPFVELALMIKVGGLIGVLPVLGLLIFAALAGFMLIRHEGTIALSNLAQSLADMRDPSGSIANSALIFCAGIFLIAPGFLSDAVGLALLIRPVRIWSGMWLMKSFRLDGAGAKPSGFARRTREWRHDAAADIEVIDPVQSPDLSRSPWH